MFKHRIYWRKNKSIADWNCFFFFRFEILTETTDSVCLSVATVLATATYNIQQDAQIWQSNAQFLQQLLDVSNKTIKAKIYCSFHIRLSKDFWWLIFLLLFISSWNFHDVCQRFLYLQPGIKFQLDPTKDKKILHRPPL